MLTKEKLNRINELAKLSKARDLTEEEILEQKQLREEYIQVFRKTFKNQLDQIEVVD